MSFLDSDALACVGVYTIEQAATLVRLPVASVDAVVGPTPDDTTLPREFPVAIAEVDLGFDEKIITFHGLMQLWVAAQLREEHVSWRVIRYAAYQLRRLPKHDHPLTQGDFRTDGRKIFLSRRDQKKKLPKTAIDLSNRQRVFEDVIDKSLNPAISATIRAYPKNSAFLVPTKFTKRERLPKWSPTPRKPRSKGVPRKSAKKAAEMARSKDRRQGQLPLSKSSPV